MHMNKNIPYFYNNNNYQYQIKQTQYKIGKFILQINKESTNSSQRQHMPFCMTTPITNIKYT